MGLVWGGVMGGIIRNLGGGLLGWSICCVLVWVVVYLVVCWAWCSLVWVMLRGFVLWVIVGCVLGGFVFGLFCLRFWLVVWFKWC